MARPNVKDILEKYGNKLETQVNNSVINQVDYSSDYVRFKNEMAHTLNRYEKWCKSLGNIIKLKISEKDQKEIKKDLDAAHLDVEPWQAITLAMLSFASVFLIGFFISIAVVLINDMDIGSFPFLFFVLVIMFSGFIFFYTKNYPKRFANKHRLKASSQMVPAILYVVVYMRHTPNLEKAIAFASQHLEYPLALDFKKVFYDVQIGKHSTIKESLDSYLEQWREFNPEFIESFHLIEASLFEAGNERRIATLEKSLQVVLDGVYDKMLKFTHEVKSPLTNVYMLGVVLPTLALALLPLASAMLGGMLHWTHVFVLFNLIVPFFVFYLTDKIMMNRPGGHGEVQLLEKNPYYYEYKSKKPYLKSFLIALPLIILALLPFIFQYTPLPDAIGIPKDPTFEELGIERLGSGKFFGFEETDTGVVGPFGIGSLILSLFFPLGIVMFFTIAYKGKTKNLIKHRQNTEKLEGEFNSSLFQLGNQLGNGVPPELVFGKVAESSKGLKTEDFFRKVDYNIKQGGMNVERAIFDSQRGALRYYPSSLISTSMRILIESSKKGLKIAAISLMAISEYVKNIDKITMRLKDMLAEVVSDMKSNMTFLAPLLSGVVVGLAAMIVTILSKLALPEMGSEAMGVGGLGDLTTLFLFTDMIPSYFLQIAISIYIIQIIFILSNTLVVVNSGQDKLQRTYETGKNLFRGVLLYLVVAFFAILGLFILASVVMSGVIT